MAIHFCITDSVRRLAAGMIPRATGLLRLFADRYLPRSGGWPFSANRLVSPAGTSSARSARPSCGEGFAQRAETSAARLMARMAGLLFFVAATLLCAHPAVAKSVDNTAYASFKVDSLPQTTESNEVSIAVRTPSEIEFLKYAPLSSAAEAVPVSVTKFKTGDGFRPSPPPVDLSSPLPLMETTTYHENEPIFIRLTDKDQNTDPNVVNTVLVTLTIPGTSEYEVLIFSETGPNTGVFTGNIDTVITSGYIPENGTLYLETNSTIVVTYTDIIDGTDTSAAAALVDPYGIIFDSLTGTPINGAIITFIDAKTGQPAVIYGDDGVSLFPSSIVSGGTATDSSGRDYDFPAGYYRFPYVQPGSYILDVTPPPGYIAPSTVSTIKIQALPQGPFSIVTGSRGEEFQVDPGPAIHIDIPLDPIRNWLHLTKTASKATVAIGDYLQYKVTVDNTGTTDVTDIIVSDRLPPGLRYRKGTTKINDLSVADPALSVDGRTLIFNTEYLAAGKSATISYIVEVGVGTPLGPCENIAQASGSNSVTSNTARAEILVKEDLFNGRSMLVGRVFPDGCPNPESNEVTEGLSGVRLYLEDGTYTVTDKKGLYHFEGVEPGTHVVQLDLESLSKDYELITCEENSRFARTPFSQFVDLQGGTLWRADFYTKKKPDPPPVIINGSVGLELASVLGKDTQGADEVIYTVTLHVGEIPTANQRLTIILPDGIRYLPKSSVLDGSPVDEPENLEGMLTYRLGDKPARWVGKLSIKGIPAAELKSGDLTAKAMLTFNTRDEKNKRTPLVENIMQKKVSEKPAENPAIILHPLFEEFGFTLNAADKQILDSIIADLKQVTVTHIEVTGHTNSTRIAPRSQHIMADNYALSRARAKTVADYLQAGLNLQGAQMTVDGKGQDEPIASNKTAEGRALNRRVELKILSVKMIESGSELKNIKEYSGIKSIEITELKKAEISADEEAKKARLLTRTMPEFDSAWLESTQLGFGFVWPYEGYYPSMPSTKIAVKFDPKKRMKLLLNGEEVNAVYLDGTTKRADNQLAVNLWFGIHLYDGDNLFEAIELDADGREERRIRRTIHYSTSPVKAEVSLERSKLTADGKNSPVIAIRLTDKDGHPAREGLTGEYKLDPPYLPQQQLDDLQENPLLLSKSSYLKYEIGEDGIASIKLQPTTRTGEAVVRFNFSDDEKEVRTWLTAGEREWIIVGFAEGTAGYNTLSGNTENLNAAGINDEYYDDDRLVFFAKGMIQGKWLLTAAYDSDKAGMRKAGSLHNTIDPQQYYTLYGDTTVQQYEAASARRLYLKIERDKFYALFGDFETGLSITELSKYNRSFNGLKAERKGENFDFNLFASDTNQAFVKDELRGDGTSGLYRLSRENIVINSESITIESRDRYRSEVIISTQKLTRHTDYDIDYEAGTIFFKSPVASQDQNFNPTYIVIDYESADIGDTSFNYGGRLAVRFADKRVEVGATHIHEDRVGGEGNLYGVDATVKIQENTTVKAELAATKSEFYGDKAQGVAYLAEVTHQSDRVNSKIYLREQDSDFGLGQQMGSESGTRKVGLDGSYRWTDNLSLQTAAYRQYNLETDAVRDMAELKTNLNAKRYSLYVGLRHAQDDTGDGTSNNSEQLVSGLNVNFFGDKLVLRVGHDQSLPGSNENGDFPTRTMIGADYKISEDLSFFVTNEFMQGVSGETKLTRIGLKSSPWSGAQVSSALEQQVSENGTRVFSVAGLKQAWQLSKKWSIDAGLDRSQTIKDSASAPFNTNVPAISGGSDFTAVSGGVSYREEKWSWSGRLEVRTSDSEDKVGLSSGIYGEVKAGLGLGAAAQVFKTDAANGSSKTSGDLRFSLAYRPQDSAWTFVDRLDYLFDQQDGNDFTYDNWRLINNIHANWKNKYKTQISLHYGAKYVNETIDDQEYSGYTDLAGFEYRYDMTKKLDIGLTGKLLHSWEAEQLNFGAGASIGYNLIKNAWFSVGYNFLGFNDRDFSAADFTAQGPYVKFRFKFDQNSLQDVLKQF